MADPVRLNVSLDAEHAEKLRRRAAQAHLKEGTLARSLLSTVLDQLDEADSSATVVELLDGIPGALERAGLGRAQAKAGDAVPLSDW
ncbi:MAG: hypothetical protein JHD16_04625 [Solirubrobacteraceae bacterium]|nr:hypothetical protein [Solirubrobacteraceae bacterium]